MITFIFILLFLLSAVSSASAAFLWASPSGGASTASNCAAAKGTSDPKAYVTFTQARNNCNLSAGDTLYLKGALGNYGTLIMGVESGSGAGPQGTNWTTGAITITSAPNETATIVGMLNEIGGGQYRIWDRITINPNYTVRAVDISGSTRVRVSNLTVRRSGFIPEGGGGGGAGISATTCTECELINNDVNGSWTHGAYVNGSRNIVRGGTYNGGGVAGNPNFGGYGIQMYPYCVDCEISGTRVFNNESQSPGLYITCIQDPCGGNKIFNNVVYMNHTGIEL